MEEEENVIKWLFQAEIFPMYGGKGDFLNWLSNHSNVDVYLGSDLFIALISIISFKCIAKDPQIFYRGTLFALSDSPNTRNTYR